MTAPKAIEFLLALNAKKVKQKNANIVQASCPLARWNHGSKQDATPSFGLFVKDGGRSHYNCFVCGSGSAEELIGTLELWVPENEKGDYDFVKARLMLDDELQVMPLPDYEEFQKPVQVFVEWPLWWLDSFTAAGNVEAAVDYLKKRDVPLEQISQFDLRWDSKRQMVVFPYWNVYGAFAGARGRAVDPEATGLDKHYEYTTTMSPSNSKLVWYNETSLNLGGPVVIVEGQFDVLRVAQKWPKVVGNFTATPTDEKIKKLTESPLWVLIPDPDEAGQKSRLKYADFAHKYSKKLRVIELEKDADGTKIDPALCHPDFLLDRIKEAIGS